MYTCIRRAQFQNPPISFLQHTRGTTLDVRGEREKSGVRTPRRAGAWRHRSRSRSRSFALELDAPRGKLDLKGAGKRRGGLAALPAQRERRPPFPPSAARLCEGVEEDAADGDGGSERAGRSERVAEDDEGDEDDGDAPMGVEPMGSESLREVHGVPCREAEGRGGRGEERRGGRGQRKTRL